MMLGFPAVEFLKVSVWENGVVSDEPYCYQFAYDYRFTQLELFIKDDLLIESVDLL